MLGKSTKKLINFKFNVADLIRNVSPDDDNGMKGDYKNRMENSF